MTSGGLDANTEVFLDLFLATFLTLCCLLGVTAAQYLRASSPAAARIRWSAGSRRAN
jgi:hypothetical protein